MEAKVSELDAQLCTQQIVGAPKLSGAANNKESSSGPPTDPEQSRTQASWVTRGAKWEKCNILFFT